MRFFISDLHFFHEDIIRCDNRGFENLAAMHETMIDRWNGKVKSKDEVIILGDFSFGTPAETMNILKRLNGTKYLILGNHDKYVGQRGFDKKMFGWIESYKEIMDERRKVVLSHFPMIFYHGQYDADYLGNFTTYMLHGHVYDFQDAQILNL